MDTRTLRLLVYNIDVNRKHRVVGQTLLDLKDLDLSQGRMNLTADLEKYVKTSDAEMPEVLVSVCYNETISRLTVNVVECKNVKVTDRLNQVLRKIYARFYPSLRAVPRPRIPTFGCN